MEKFVIGLAIGGVVGAMIVANNQKMRMLVKKAQDEAQEKIDAFVEEKMGKLCNASESAEEDSATASRGKKRK